MNYYTREFINISGRHLLQLCSFLQKSELRYENDAEYTLNYYNDSDEIIATGSICGNVFKYIAVAEEAQGEGIAAALVSGLVSRAHLSGRRKMFLFTKIANKPLFQSLGFFALAETDTVVLMENSRNGLTDYINSLDKGNGVQGAVVMNCNPFTLGHRFLVSRAAECVDTLHVFVVKEDKSEFPFKDRFMLVKKGCEDIPNVLIHDSGDYIISYATFPTYFIKNKADSNKINAELDLTLFGGKIAPALNIKKRFVGTEPFCKVTDSYNDCMKKILPRFGIDVVEIERFNNISAGAVRTALARKDWDTIKNLVPNSTLEYLIAKSGGATHEN